MGTTFITRSSYSHYGVDKLVAGGVVTWSFLAHTLDEHLQRCIHSQSLPQNSPDLFLDKEFSNTGIKGSN